MTYQAPLHDILHAITDVAGQSLAPEVADGTAAAVIEEAGRFACDILAPIDQGGDQHGIRFADGAVATAPGFRQAYAHWIEAGWGGVAAPAAYGGQDLGRLIQSACLEVWGAANPSFTIGPLLSMSAIEALQAHGSEPLKALYLPKLISGAWAGTMNLTEPQAGSDLGALKTRAEPAEDGRFRITGSKIFITYGEHDLTENIVHLVLARLPDAAPGSRGISLFLVPKFLVAADGSLGARNAVFCTGVERKLGMHAAPTCSMRFEGATGSLVGEPGRGLNAMFTMMNQARLAVGLQGVGAAERATQQAIAYAKARRQGRAPGAAPGETASPIIHHPDVARMCLTMKALTAAARALCTLTAAALDAADRAEDAAQRAAAAGRAALLTPLAKAFSTDIANEVTSLNLQVHGGTGYVEATGAAQLMRDVRIAAIYEGTNGIQALDLVGRKLNAQDGAPLAAELAAMRASVAQLAAVNDPAFGQSALRLGEALDALERATTFLRQRLERAPAEATAGASAYLRLFSLARGGTALADGALALRRREAPAEERRSRIGLARFFAEQLSPSASGLATAIIEGSSVATDWAGLLGD